MIPCVWCLLLIVWKSVALIGKKRNGKIPENSMMKFIYFLLSLSHSLWKHSKEGNKQEKQMLCEPRILIYSLTPWHCHHHEHINNHNSFLIYIWKKLCTNLHFTQKHFIYFTINYHLNCLVSIVLSPRVYRIFVLPVVETTTKHWIKALENMMIANKKKNRGQSNYKLFFYQNHH